MSNCSYPEVVLPRIQRAAFAPASFMRISWLPSPDAMNYVRAGSQNRALGVKKRL